MHDRDDDWEEDEWSNNEYVTNLANKLDEAIIFINARSLRKNFHRIKELFNSNDVNPAIIAITEIWSPLQCHETMPGYHNLVKHERGGTSANKGGGVAFFIRNNLSFNRMTMTFIDHEFEAIGIEIVNKNITILCCYRPPCSNVAKFINILSNEIGKIKQSNINRSKIIIGGDFNIDTSECSANADLLNDTMQEAGLCPIVNMPTRITSTSSSTLDLIFTNDPGMTAKIAVTDFSDHLSPFCTILPKEDKVELSTKRRKLTMNNVNKLKAKLDTVDWQNELDLTNPTKKFHQILERCMDSTCPYSKTIQDKRHCPSQKWMTKELLDLRRQKMSAHKRAIMLRDDTSLRKYRELRANYNNQLRTHKKKHLEKQINMNRGNSRRIWEIVNDSLNRGKSKSAGIQAIKTKDGTTSDKVTIAETLNNFYTTIGSNLASKITTHDSFDKFLPEQVQERLEFKEVSQNEVYKVILSMKAKKSTGYDDLSNDLIKKIANEITQPLTIIINYSIRKNEFPDEWKVARVIPLYKNKGSQEDCTNYRPISLLPTCSKIFEKIIEKQIRRYMTCNELWTKVQFGFRPLHETGHTVIRAIYEILEAKQKGLATAAVFLDLKKAFDTVDHAKLLLKLERYGIDHRLIKDYLSRRKQFTEVDGYKSSHTVITCGVPQGSILGPLIFLLYVNDLAAYTPTKTLLFADDTTLIIHGKTKEDLISNTNKAIQDVSAWFLNNKLTVHPEKTNFMIFNLDNKQEINNKIIWGDVKLERIGKGEREEEVKYVGIRIDEDLNFQRHGQHVVNKIKQNSYLISCNKNLLPFTTRKMLYNSLVRPYMDYGCEIWGMLNINNTFKAQKKCIRHVMRSKNFIDHTNKHFKKLKTPKFPDLIKYHQTRLCHKIVHMPEPQGLQEILPVPRRDSRRPCNILVPNHNHCSNKETLLPPISAPMTWNALDEETKRCSNQKTFKCKFMEAILDQYDKETPCTIIGCPSCKPSQPFN